MEYKNQGKLSIESDNIFTILKKWLYTEPDIVFRELISNATDAIEKRALLDSSSDKANHDLPDSRSGTKGRIDVLLDAENKRLIIRDNGIGMDYGEVHKYINNIAFSGAEDFIRSNHEAGENSIIGHFGVGFYSAFMLTNHAAIETKSYKKDSPAVRWDCRSDMSFEMTGCEKEQIGTDIILYLDEENVYLKKPALIYESIRKYFIFSGYDIFFTSPEHDQVLLNHTSAVWRKKTGEVSADEMNSFYMDFFGETSPPLFWIQFASVDIGVRGILFFRNTKNGTEELDGVIKVYSRGIYIGENIPELIPKFVNLQSGILECDNLPLVVSRSGIQTEPSEMLGMIYECLSQEVTIALHDMFRNQRKVYESHWPELNAFVKYGVMQDKTFASVMTKRIVFMDIYGHYRTIEEYLSEAAGTAGGTIYYASDHLDQAHYISIFRKCNVNALLFDHVIDRPLLYKYETVSPNWRFVRIDSNINEIYGGLKEQGDDERTGILTEKIEAALEGRLGTIAVSFTRLADKSISALIVNDEATRRVADMMELYGYKKSVGDEGKEEHQTQKALLFNLCNPIVEFVLNSSEEIKNHGLINQLFDLALLSQQALRPEDMEEFINRSERILCEIL